MDASKKVFCGRRDFSYPAEILPGRDGRLVRFCKKVEGELTGENLLAAMAQAGYRQGKKFVILNDTVVTLLMSVSTSYQMLYDSYVGFILGTGPNCCYVEESNRSMGKLSGLDNTAGRIVNVESGAFAKAPRGRTDIRYRGLEKLILATNKEK